MNQDSVSTEVLQSAHSWPTKSLFGLSIAALTMSEVLDAVHARLSNRQKLLIGVVNAAKIVNMRRNEILDESVRSADIILADGMSVVWASRMLRRRLPERIPGIDLMHGLLERGRTEGYRVYFLGATKEVLSKVISEVESLHPGVVIAGFRDGYFEESDEQGVADAIRESRADILLVAMTSPKKERFLAKWFDHMHVPVCHGVGGSFDVVAGKVKRAPVIWQRMGMEWLYRVLQEPRRLWRRYFITNTLFLFLTIKEFFSPTRCSTK